MTDLERALELAERGRMRPTGHDLISACVHEP